MRDPTLDSADDNWMTSRGDDGDTQRSIRIHRLRRTNPSPRERLIVLRGRSARVC
jgi:hypothetical protein